MRTQKQSAKPIGWRALLTLWSQLTPAMRVEFNG
jgi:hypothetical protein